MKHLLILFLLAATLFSAHAGAEGMDYRTFGELPVLADGRIKPLDSLARVMLQRINGNVSFEGRSASQWLADVFFAPQAALQTRMFSIPSAQAAQMLGLAVRADHLYSFQELAETLQTHADFLSALSRKDKSALTRDEADVARVYGATGDFVELTDTFSLLMPFSDAKEARAVLHLPENAPVTFFDIQKHRQELDDAMRQVMDSKGPMMDSYTPQERSLAQIVTRLALQEAVDRDNALVRVIPPAWSGEEWLSPWGVLKASEGSPQSARMLKSWRDAAYAYRAKDAHAWNEAMRKLQDASHGALSPFADTRLSLEYIYNQLGLLPVCMLLYALGLVAMAFSFGKWHRSALATARAGLLAGLFLHGAALTMRMLILMRPPVSTLYESLIFVSFVIMAVSNWLGWSRRHYAGLFVGALTALMLLLVSEIFAGDGDTLGVLVAVLNTNFWLATHVVCITTGYASALVTGAIAHLYLFRSAVLRTPEPALAPLARLLHRVSLFALLFTAVGTMLGGIWADQSWGRFWGWDPKENGALLIVLWLIWLLHGRIAGQLRAFSFAACAALVNVVVALAWIGVNLLSVGLHSYGFTDAAATGLVAFCGAEFAFVAAMAVIQRFARAEARVSSSAG